MQHPNRWRGVISNDQIRGFKLIIIYNKFYFFIRISGEYVFVNQCFHYFFIGFIIVLHLVTIKKFDICLSTGWLIYTYNYGQYLNQFPPNTIKVIREFERIQKKICRHKMSIMFNEICINEEMLPKYTYFKYICMYLCVCVCVCVCFFFFFFLLQLGT